MLSGASSIRRHGTFSSCRQLRDWTVIVKDEHGYVISEQGIKFLAKGRALHGNVWYQKAAAYMMPNLLDDPLGQYVRVVRESYVGRARSC